MNIDFNVVILGIMISIIFYEITDISPGGIIVPGLLAMYITSPERIVYTVIVAIITYYIVKALSQYFIIFGKRRFVLMIIIGLILNIILEFILGASSINLISISAVGYTLTGLIANDIYKQGMKKTIPALAIVMSIIVLIVIISGEIGF